MLHVPPNSMIWTNLTQYGLIQVSGQDATNYLQGQLTCDLKEINDSQSRFAAYCNHKGRIRALMRVFQYQDSYLLRLPKELIDTILNTLKKYQLRSKINLEDVSQAWTIIGIIGDLPQTVIQEISQPSELDAVSMQTQSFLARVVETPPRMEYYSCQGGSILQTALSKIAQPSDENYWQLNNIQNGIPEIYLKTTEMFLPHSLDLPELNAISFQKGCYCGQEIIARMHYRTVVKRHMFRVTFTTVITPYPGMEISLISEPKKIIGNIVIVASLEENHYEALIEIPDQYAQSKLLALCDTQGEPLIDLSFG